MKTSTLLRFITIFVFILLIAVFVSYRSGVFSDDSAEPVISVIDTSGRSKAPAPDTLPVIARKSSVKVDSSALMDSILTEIINSSPMSSSKSIIVTPEREQRLMESTKLGRIFPPTGNSIKPKNDSIVLLPQKQ